MPKCRLPIPPKAPGNPAPSPALSGILDNRDNGAVGEFLREKIVPGAEVRVVSAYFSIHAHRALRAELNKAGAFRFLFGDPRSVGNVVAGRAIPKRFLINDEGGAERDEELADILTQKHAAQQCAEWMKRDDVHIRTMRDEFLHGKMFHIAPPQNAAPAAVCGSSNFTARGLGINGGNRELNIVADPETCGGLRKWFEALWQNQALLRDAKPETLEALARLGRDQDPEFVYFLALFRLFGEELEKIARDADDLRLEDSQIWSALYPFQRDAVYGIIRRLKRRGGCVLADSVGLGKTHTALAVVKYFQNERVLVLCPKRLAQNWNRFLFDAEGGNPLRDDNFHYRVCAHTDLGKPNPGVDWNSYDLVVIDESHNFRNAAGARYKTLRAALKKSGAKVLMLSATPVNISLKDLRNQIQLMADDGDFARDLGIASVAETVRRSQAGFARWEQSGGDRDALIEHLGGAFLKLADAVSIARNRRHVREHYAAAFAENGGALDDFPKSRKPEEHSPQTDSRGELSYAKIHRDIETFGLSVYRPSAYLRDARAREQLEDKQTGFKQTDRERFLIGMMRVNLLKRLESSPHSFCLTLRRTIEKIQGVEDKIARVRGGAAGVLIDENDAPDPDEYGEDDDFMVGKGLRYDLREMRRDDWARDLKNDRKALEKILALAEKVTPARDAKLAELKNILRDKTRNPPTDKDGKPNRKALVFTAFSDTAEHLYRQLRNFARDELNANIGLVVGSGANRTTADIGATAPVSKTARSASEPDRPAGHADILDRFSPRARNLPDPGPNGEIDILVATDCVSEGQNLQDCDLVVNYDIHWNPVRIIQRFGRVDRIGGRNREVRRADFWPHMNLNQYLKLRERVNARMALAGAVAAGDAGDDDPEREAKRESDFRDEQLKRLRQSAMDADDLGVSAADFTMADFIAELRAFLQSRRDELQNAPDGLFAVVETDPEIGARPGIIFCLRQKNPGDDDDRKRDNITHPHFLAYVCDGDNGRPQVRFGFPRAKKILRLFGDLCRGKKEPLRELCDAFDAKIQNGENMTEVNAALAAAVSNIADTFARLAARSAGPDGDGELPELNQQPRTAADFELVAWLVIRDRPL